MPAPGFDPRQSPLGEAAPQSKTPETFQQNWGDCGFEGDQLDDMWFAAKSRYIDLPYHNFDHSLDTLWAVMKLADKLEANGIAVNRKVLVGAALLHDADFHKPLDGSGFETKEARSAAIFADYAEGFGYTDDEIELGRQAILDTTLNRQPETPEGKILVRGDLDNIAGDYQTGLVQNTELLRQELEILSGEAVNFDDYAIVSLHVLAAYLSCDLSLGPVDDTYAEWEARAIDNLRTLASSVKDRSRLAEFAALLGDSALGDNPD